MIFTYRAVLRLRTPHRRCSIFRQFFPKHSSRLLATHWQIFLDGKCIMYDIYGWATVCPSKMISFYSRYGQTTQTENRRGYVVNNMLRNSTMANLGSPMHCAASRYVISRFTRFSLLAASCCWDVASENMRESHIILRTANYHSQIARNGGACVWIVAFSPLRPGPGY